MKSKTINHIIIIIILLFLTFPVANFTEDASVNIISSVYSKFTGKNPAKVEIITDESGVAIVDHGYINGIYIGKQRNPVTISQKAFEYEEEFKKGNQSSRQLLLNSADWLVDNTVHYDNYTVWEYNYSFATWYNMTPPWRSGMAQGQGIQALTKAYNLSKDEKYLKVARTSLNSFFIEVQNGGVTHKENDGWWYEEYADENGSNPRVLNGMMWTLLGIQEYYELTADENAKFLFDKGIVALKNHLPEYDTGHWSYYNAFGEPASKFYHHVHVMQLSQLYDITKEPIFKEYHDKWEGYEDSPLRFYYRNVKQYRTGIYVYLLNFLALFLLSEIILYLYVKMNKRALDQNDK